MQIKNAQSSNSFLCSGIHPCKNRALLLSPAGQDYCSS